MGVRFRHSGTSPRGLVQTRRSLWYTPAVSASRDEPWRQAAQNSLRAVHGRIEGHEGTLKSGKAGARGSMQIRIHWQTVTLVSALALTSVAVSATPQDHIALSRDTNGRAVYVNAAHSSGPKPDSADLASTAPNRDAALHKLIRQTADSLAIDPQLVEAMVRVESGYDAHARSPKGALGLMQLMPATAARLGVANAFDAGQNIRGGVTYLGHLLKQFNGDVPLSLAAYNAGEGAVLRERGIPPFEETRDYIRRITALYPSSAAWTGSTPRAHPPALLSQIHNRALTADNAAPQFPIYRYMDTAGVIHFSQ